jgi:protein-disulfide isomerase
MANVASDSVPVPNWEKYLKGGHSRGAADAPVTILEFGDYECPFCARYAPTVDSILDAFPLRVRFVYRHWPLNGHRNAYPAARAAECAADQGKFWEVHSLLYAKTDSLGLLPFSEFGRRAGVADMAEYIRCIDSQQPVAVIDQGEADARAIGATGTPTVLINGIRLRGGAAVSYVERLLRQMER